MSANQGALRNVACPCDAKAAEVTQKERDTPLWIETQEKLYRQREADARAGEEALDAQRRAHQEAVAACQGRPGLAMRGDTTPPPAFVLLHR